MGRRKKVLTLNKSKSNLYLTRRPARLYGPVVESRRTSPHEWTTPTRDRTPVTTGPIVTSEPSLAGRHRGPYRCDEGLRRDPRRRQSGSRWPQTRPLACCGQPRHRVPRRARGCAVAASDDAVDQDV